MVPVCLSRDHYWLLGRWASTLVNRRLWPESTDRPGSGSLLAFRRRAARRCIGRGLGKGNHDLPVLNAACRRSEGDWSSGRRQSLHVNGCTGCVVPGSSDDHEDCGENHASRDDLSAAIHSNNRNLGARFCIGTIASLVARIRRFFADLNFSILVASKPLCRWGQNPTCCNVKLPSDLDGEPVSAH